MNLSKEKRTDLWDELECLARAEKSEGTRSDIATLLLYRDGFNAVNPLFLFWELYMPQVVQGGAGVSSGYSPAPKLSPRAERLVLSILEDLHDRHRVPYEPDDSDSDITNYFRAHVEYPSVSPAPETLTNLLILIHVAAARAFTLKKASGLSEEVWDCLNEIERAWQRLQLAGLGNWEVREAMDLYEVFHSIEIVSALALLERSWESKRQSRYSESLHRIAEAACRYDSGIHCEMIPDDSWPLENTEPSGHRPSHDFYSFLTGMHAPLEDCLDIFRLLRESSSADNDWRQVADDCKRLAHDGAALCFPATPQESYGKDVYDIYMVQSERPILLDMDRKESGPGIGGLGLTWREFWLNASAWASAQLSPSEYRRMREQDNKDAAENRLKNYFFHDAWNTLPPQAQESLINADVNWNSKQRMRREAILNDLLRATEAMCRKFIWQPLANTEESSRGFLHFLRRDSEIAENPGRSQPEVRDFIWVCEQPFFLEFIEQRNLSERLEFLTENLPATMRQLADSRNRAEHDEGAPTPIEVIESTFQLFLGIGCSGILPELAQIGQELQSDHSRRSHRL